MNLPPLLKKLLPRLLCLCSLFAPPLHAQTTFHKQPYYSLPEAAHKLGMKFRWIIPQESASLSRGSTEIELTAEKRVCIINDIQVWLGNPILSKRGQLFISKKDLDWSIQPIVKPKNLNRTVRHIVIDPGHGGKDQGTSNSAYAMLEKDLTLDLAYRLKDVLKKRGYSVSMTRQNDTFIPLKDRATFANQNNADLFLSLHFNSVINGKDSVKGSETYALTIQDHPSTANSKISTSDSETNSGNQYNTHNALLAYCVQNSLCKHLSTQDRGVKRARFGVLKNLNCPGILLESAFLSNSEECHKLKSPLYREKLAKCIAKGVVDYDRVIKNPNS